MIDAARLLADLKSLPTQRTALGDEESQKGLIKTEELLTQDLRELGYNPTIEPLVWNRKYQAEQEAKFLQPEDRPAAPTDELAGHIWHNLIVEIPGKELPKEVLILSSHFDAAPKAPGADDDGTGVAALLEIARVLKDQPMRRTVRLIFFNLEEVGLKGSAEYVQAHHTDNEKVIGMVSLEMLGFYSDKPNSQKSPIPKIEGVFDPPTVGDFIGLGTISKFQEFSQRFNKEMLASAPGIKIVVADFMPIAPPDFLRSDHAPFMRVGIPGAILTDTSNFRNPNYHKPTDTIDTLDQPRFTLTVRAVAGAAYRIAEPVATPQP
jgi:Zn-dependent M28 family amino/carboxypeptidase